MEKTQETLIFEKLITRIQKEPEFEQQLRNYLNDSLKNFVLCYDKRLTQSADIKD